MCLAGMAAPGARSGLVRVMAARAGVEVDASARAKTAYRMAGSIGRQSSAKETRETRDSGGEHRPVAHLDRPGRQMQALARRGDARALQVEQAAMTRAEDVASVAGQIAVVE